MKAFNIIYTFKSLYCSRHDLVEDVVGTFQTLLGDDTGFFQQVGLDISTSQFTSWAEMNTDEFTLGKYKC